MDNSQRKERWTLGRVARLAFRAFALATLVALLVGWVASYRGMFNLTRIARSHWLVLTSYQGRVAVGLQNVNDGQAAQAHWLCSFRRSSLTGDAAWTRLKEFEGLLGDQTWTVFALAPYWFLTTLAAMATALSFKRTWRFTTRQLLVAMTAIAALLAAGVWSMRG
jgi:hypothetical protein